MLLLVTIPLSHQCEILPLLVNGHRATPRHRLMCFVWCVCVGLCHVLARLPHDKVTSSFDGLCWMHVEQLDLMVGLRALLASFLQRVSIACYAERCISYDRFCPTV